MKKILIACHYSSTYEGNFIPQIKTISTSLLKQNQISYAFPKKAMNCFWINYFINNFDCFFYKDFEELSFYIENTKPDIVFAHHYSIFYISPLAKKNPKIKFVFHARSTTYLGKKQKILTILDFFIHLPPKNLFIISVSKQVKNTYFGFSRLFHNKVVENGIDITRLSYKNIQPYTNGKFKLLMFGYNYKLKGVDIAIKALKLANEQSENGFELFIVCDINKEEINDRIKHEFPNLKNYYIIDSQIDPSVLYSKCDAFISPSRHEGFCFSLLEAAYCNCPVIYSNISAQIHPPLNRIRFSRGNYKSLANKMIYISKHYSKERLFIEQIQDNLFKKYSIEKWTMNIIKTNFFE